MHSFVSHVSRFVGVHEVMNTINTVCTSVINCVIDMPMYSVLWVCMK